MDLYQLRVLRELGDHGSVAATARSLGITSSSVSQTIATLQRTFTAPLTQKRGRSVELTEAGRSLAVAAIGVAEAMARAESAVDEFIGGVNRTVRVSAFHSAAIAFFPLLAARPPSATFPGVECVDEDVDRDSFPTLTARYDLVIGGRMSHTPPWDQQRLTVIPLLQEPMDIAMHESHPLAGKTQLHPADLLGTSWISTHAGFSPADLLQSISAAAGEPMRVAHRINDFGAASAMVAASSHLTIVPRHTVRPSLHEHVVLRPIVGVASTRHIDILMRPERVHHRAVAHVVAALHDIVQAQYAPLSDREAGTTPTR
ncbi:DNA-binding transcriptional LysR family regulator [Leucobacter exalbidus]|uniref:DNA-binding transcriptional LysR family regulator n=1 Tax=Leucobacter exalbidus TaxID=662960 RepID=A0A940PVB4_9MICO|nr:LysR family transcriptional regulator [Leucobacter exalbidus]MBP1324866.1 DNA-binding transcriptional LysR family regulator [Leucobacter exalbidus]